MLEDLVDRLDTLDVSANLYRTAVRLARRANGYGAIVLSHEQLREIVGTDSDDTARSHLIKLHKAGLLWFRRNSVISVSFVQQPVITTRANRAPDDQIDRVARDVEVGGRACGDQFDHDVISNGDEDETERACGEQKDHGTREKITTRAKRSSGDHPIGRLVGRPVGGSIPTNQPGGVRGGEPQTVTATALTADQRRTVALLTDPEVGMDAVTATKLAQKHAFAFVRAHVFAVLDDMRQGKVQKIYVLPSRLSRGGTPKITDVDRQSALWKRHADEQDDAQWQRDAEEDLRRKYIPPGYEGVIIG